MAIGSPRPSSKASKEPPLPTRPSALLASRTTGVSPRRSQSAKCLSSGVTPVRASTTKSTTSASETARFVCPRMRAERLSSASSSRPAVSMTRKLRSASRASPSRRSRVTPGVSSTSARRCPTSRLKSVDLPTFGRPMMAAVKLMSYRLPHRNEVSLVGQHVERLVGDDRREKRAVRQFDAPKRRAGIGRERHRLAVRGDDDQAVAAKDGAGPGQGAFLFLEILVARQLLDPAHAAVAPRQADQLAVIADDEDEVSGDPGRFGAADILLPDALAGAKIDRHHATAMADGVDATAIDDWAAADIGKRRQRIRPARGSEAVGP